MGFGKSGNFVVDAMNNELRDIADELALMGEDEWAAIIKRHATSELAALERELAEEAAKCDLESVGWREGDWFRSPEQYPKGYISPPEMDHSWQAEKRDFANAVRYLELRGLLERHDQVVEGGNPDWVRIK